MVITKDKSTFVEVNGVFYDLGGYDKYVHAVNEYFVVVDNGMPFIYNAFEKKLVKTVDFNLEGTFGLKYTEKRKRCY